MLRQPCQSTAGTVGSQNLHAVTVLDEAEPVHCGRSAPANAVINTAVTVIGNPQLVAVFHQRVVARSVNITKQAAVQNGVSLLLGQLGKGP